MGSIRASLIVYLLKGWPSSSLDNLALTGISGTLYTTSRISPSVSPIDRHCNKDVFFFTETLKRHYPERP